MTDKRTVKIIKHLDRDQHGVFVESVERTLTGKEIRRSEKRGTSGRPTGQYRISYKGLDYISFNLPACYGECSGMVISVDRPVENKKYFANSKRAHEVIDIRYEK